MTRMHDIWGSFSDAKLLGHLHMGEDPLHSGWWTTFLCYFKEVRCLIAGLWVGDCFIYTNGAWRLNYCVGGEVTTMFHLDRPMYLLGYLASQSKVYLIDKVSTPGPRMQACGA